jgi:hypothetical protein
MKVLYVEDNEQDADLTARRLARLAPDIALATAYTLADARARLAADEAANALPDVLLATASSCWARCARAACPSPW